MGSDTVSLIVNISGDMAEQLEVVEIETGITKSGQIESLLQQSLRGNGAVKNTLDKSVVTTEKIMRMTLDTAARALLILQKDLSAEDRSRIKSQAKELLGNSFK